MVSAGNPVTVTFTVANEGPDAATGIYVSGSVSSGVTFNSATAGSGTCSGASNNAVVCLIPTLQSGATSTVVFSVTPTGTCSACSATATVVNVNNTVANVTANAPFIASAYSMNVTPSGQVVTAGLPAHYTVTLAPTQGVFGNNVSLSCGTLPSGTACNWSSSSVSFNGGVSNASSVLTLSTTAQPVTTGSSGAERRPLYALWLMVPGMALLGLGAGGKRRGKVGRLLGLFTISMLFALVLLQPSCSGSKTQPTVSGTPSGTYSLTITATSGTFSKSQTVQLTVIP